MLDFSNFIHSLLQPIGPHFWTKLAPILLDQESLTLYQKSFTHCSYDSVNNYEVYEQLGDITVNKFLVWYFHNRFSTTNGVGLFNSTLGVKVVARLRIKYGSKQFLSQLADQLGFWDHIRITESVSAGKRLSILEDVFEAFIGVTEYIIDRRFHPESTGSVGIGYMCCYNILKHWFDAIPIDVSYEQLFDAKTRCKELFDLYKEDLGTVIYEYEKQGQNSIVRVYRQHGENKIFICSASSLINKSMAEQQASEEALVVLCRQGFIKEIPNEYRQLLGQLLAC
jgi:dsRNA-specific ribonuclease